MSITIQLAPHVEERIREHATRHGITVEEYLRGLAEEDAAEDEPLPATPAEAVAYWDRVGTRGVYADGSDSPARARALREAEERSRDDIWLQS